jgi:aryl-alcohol dehydrogenase-like predicted oxidoreductase
MISTQPFGRTGFESTRILFGAAALAGMRPARVAATHEILERYDVNHIDTAISYGDVRGVSDSI